MVNKKKQDENTRNFINKGITDKIKDIEDQQTILKKDGVSQRFIDSLTPDQTNKILNNNEWSYTYPQLFLAYQDKGGTNTYKKFINVISNSEARQRQIKRKADQTPYMTTGEISKLVADSVASSAWVGGNLGKIGAIWKGTRAGLKASTRDGLTLGELVGKLASAGVKNAKLSAKQLVGIIDRKTTKELIDNEKRLFLENERISQEDASMLSEKENAELDKINSEWSKAQQELKFRLDEEKQVLKKTVSQSRTKIQPTQSFQEQIDNISYKEIQNAIDEQLIQDDKLYGSMEGFYRQQVRKKLKLAGAKDTQNYTEEQLQLLKNKYNSEIVKNKNNTYTNLKERSPEQSVQPVEENIDPVEETPLINRRRGKTRIQPIEKPKVDNVKPKVDNAKPKVDNAKKTDEILPNDEPALPNEERYEGLDEIDMNLDETVKPSKPDDESILGKGGKQGVKQKPLTKKPISNKNIGKASAGSTAVKVVEGGLKGGIVISSVVSSQGLGTSSIDDSKIHDSNDNVSHENNKGSSFRVKEDINIDKLDGKFLETVRLSDEAYNTTRDTSNMVINQKYYLDLPLMTVLFERIEETLFIAFKGTSNFNDVLIDLFTPNLLGRSSIRNNPNLAKYLNSYNQDIEFHTGMIINMNDNFNEIYRNVMKFEGAISDIVLTGHSLGSGYATIFTYVYNNMEIDVYKRVRISTTITYGSPRILVDEPRFIQKFNDSIEDYVRVFNSEDPIPYLPFRTRLTEIENKLKLNLSGNYIHVGHPFNLDDDITNNNINIFLRNLLVGNKINFGNMAERSGELTSSQLIQFLFSNRYLEFLWGGVLKCGTKLKLKEKITPEDIKLITLNLNTNLKEITEYSDKCKLLGSYGLEDYLLSEKLSDDPDLQNFQLNGMSSSILTFLYNGYYNHSTETYIKNVQEVVNKQEINQKSFYQPINDKRQTLIDIPKMIETKLQEIPIIGIIEDGKFTSGSIISF